MSPNANPQRIKAFKAKINIKLVMFFNFVYIAVRRLP